jgi:hypothetical protein
MTVVAKNSWRRKSGAPSTNSKISPSQYATGMLPPSFTGDLMGLVSNMNSLSIDASMLN